jgi:hypothetical protein
MTSENTASGFTDIPPVLREIAGGDGEPLRVVAKRYHVHTTTALRWVRNGVKRPDGSVVRLEAVRVGTRWLCHPQSLLRFLAALNQSEPPTPPPTSASTTPDKRRAAAANKKLAAAGV